LYQLLYGGKYPFLADDLQTLTSNVINDDLSFPKEPISPTPLRENLKSVAEKLMVKNPEERISSSALNELFKGYLSEMGLKKE